MEDNPISFDLDDTGLGASSSAMRTLSEADKGRIVEPMRELWSRLPELPDSVGLISEDRDR